MSLFARDFATDPLIFVVDMPSLSSSGSACACCDSGQIKEPDYALCLVLCDVDLISSVTSPMPAQFYCVCAIQSAEPQREEHVMVTRPTSRNWALGLFFVSSLDTLLPLAMSYEAHK
ncbi:hypothetical protein BRADI_4g21274v3 [Brachypodium distachyon]|uniref:Uncharacterized protein n=1 Tax=Brachypodium distachyon TaxID=15368 RepID=A0A2K2CP77_BRADI|nr:hypothetical protein BRADI_4g21274v3 [Brachypodium distachyon]